MENYAVDEIRKQFDFHNDRDVLRLYAMIQSGQIRLEGPAGRALDDEVYELAMAAKKRQASGGARAKQSQAGSLLGKRTRGATEQEKNGKDKKQHRSRAGSMRGRRIVVLTRKELLFRRFVSLLLVLVAVGCLGYFGYYCYEADRTRQENERMAALKENEQVNAMYDSQKIVQKDEETGQERVLTVLDEYKSLYNQNKNLIGWLKIADTNIDYPVMQTADNTYYLDHNMNQESDKNGTLFLDASCDVVRPSTNLIIYGHNMRSGNMFGNLDKYKSVDYYKKHPVISFDSIYEKGSYQVMYVFRSHIYREDEIAFKYYQFIDAVTQQEFDSNMRAMAEMSLYETGVEAVFGDQLLTLSTCDYEETDGRFVVVAKRIN